jgi:dTDP-4-dehydrorhamnose reductase
MAVRFAVLGATGQLGRDLCPRLPGDVVALSRATMDLARIETLDYLRQVQADVVINCAAYNSVDRAEAEPETAFRVNAWGPRRLSFICKELDCLLVHFSTDYVFGLDQARCEPYCETDQPGPLSVYGLSKLVGEYLVRANYPRHLVIRTCGLYGLWGAGGKGGNFVETMFRLAGQVSPLRVVADQVCTPTFTEDLAAAVVRLLKMGATGLVHLTNAGSCSWYDFAQAIFEESGLSPDLQPITSAEYGAAARRPHYSVLDSVHNAARSMLLRPWRQALADYLRKRVARDAGR